MAHREADIIAELEALNRFDRDLLRLAESLLAAAAQARRTNEALERFLVETSAPERHFQSLPRPAES